MTYPSFAATGSAHGSAMDCIEGLDYTWLPRVVVTHLKRSRQGTVAGHWTSSTSYSTYATWLCTIHTKNRAFIVARV